MSEENNQQRFFVNKSNKSYFFGELQRVIKPSGKIVHLFQDVEINKC
ncbi:unnamed protein product, partial [marine sediment metagenome]